MSSPDLLPPNVPLAPSPEKPSSAPLQHYALDTTAQEDAPLQQVILSDTKPVPSPGKPTPYTPGNPRHASSLTSTSLNSSNNAASTSPPSCSYVLRAHTEMWGNSPPTTVPEPLTPGQEPFPIPGPEPRPTFPGPGGDPRPIQVARVPIPIRDQIMGEGDAKLPQMISNLESGDIARDQGDIVAVTESLRGLGYIALDASLAGFKDILDGVTVGPGPVYPVPGPNAPGPVGGLPPFVGYEGSESRASGLGVRENTGCPCEDCKDAGPDAPEEFKLCALAGGEGSGPKGSGLGIKEHFGFPCEDSEDAGPDASPDAGSDAPEEFELRALAGYEISEPQGSGLGIRENTGCPCEDCEDSGPDAPEEFKFSALTRGESQPAPVVPPLSGDPINPTVGRKGFRKHHDIFNDDDDDCPEGECSPVPGTGPSAGSHHEFSSASPPPGPDPVGPPPKYSLQGFQEVLTVLSCRTSGDDSGYDGDTEKNILDALSLGNFRVILRKLDLDSGYESGESTDADDGGGPPVGDDDYLSPDEGPDGGAKLRLMALNPAIAQLKNNRNGELERALSMADTSLAYPNVTACGSEALRDCSTGFNGEYLS